MGRGPRQSAQLESGQKMEECSPRQYVHLCQVWVKGLSPHPSHTPPSQSPGINIDGPRSPRHLRALQHYKSHHQRTHSQYIPPRLRYRPLLRRPLFRNVRPCLGTPPLQYHFYHLQPCLYIRPEYTRVDCFSVFWCVGGGLWAIMGFLGSRGLYTLSLLAGLGGCTPVSIGGGIVSDVFSDRERGTAMAVYTMGPLLGPVLGPSIGTYSQHKHTHNIRQPYHTLYL